LTGLRFGGDQQKLVDSSWRASIHNGFQQAMMQALQGGAIPETTSNSPVGKK
jgi:hypothetical protein